jgi:hypothetical protein
LWLLEQRTYIRISWRWVKFSLKNIFSKHPHERCLAASKRAISKGIIEIEARIAEEDICSRKTDLLAQGHKLIREQTAVELILTAVTWEQ